MAKIVQTLGTMVFCVMQENTLEEAKQHYNFTQLKNERGIDFVECPNDKVQQQWQFVNGEFVPPIPPEGWGYDIETGVFFELNPPAQYSPADEEKVAMAEYIVNI